ncbi:VOC family protein [Nitriliruptor alkaliphilus]|uniref:VOC family protein n=1 Tax=Nitriliruptor alkaliphilus TaxID=427918 RepID=UPI0009F81A94|nr:VOC family protein [Nitriliruptor alkaliphilus]
MRSVRSIDGRWHGDGAVRRRTSRRCGSRRARDRSHARTGTTPDLRPDDGDVDREVDRLLALGASRADVGQTGQEAFVVLADPEGNEFCVLRRAPRATQP